MMKQYARIVATITVSVIATIGICTLFHGMDQVLAQTSQNGPTPAGTGAGNSPSPTNAPGILLGKPNEALIAVVNWLDANLGVDGVVPGSGASNWAVTGDFIAGDIIRATNSLTVPAINTQGATNAWTGFGHLVAGVLTVACTNIQTSDIVLLNQLLLSNSAAWVCPVMVSNINPGVGFSVVANSNGTFVTAANYSNSLSWLVVHTK